MNTVHRTLKLVGMFAVYLNSHRDEVPAGCPAPWEDREGFAKWVKDNESVVSVLFSVEE